MSLISTLPLPPPKKKQKQKQTNKSEKPKYRKLNFPYFGIEETPPTNTKSKSEIVQED